MNKYFFIFGMAIALKILFYIGIVTYLASTDKKDPLAEKNDIEYLVIPTVLAIVSGFVCALGFDLCFVLGWL